MKAQPMVIAALVSLIFSGCSVKSQEIKPKLPSITTNVFAERIAASRTRGKPLQLDVKQAIARSRKGAQT